MFCPECGKSNTDDSRFCCECGRALNITQSQVSAIKRNNKQALIIVAVVATLIIGITAYFMLGVMGKAGGSRYSLVQGSVSGKYYDSRHKYAYIELTNNGLYFTHETGGKYSINGDTVIFEGALNTIDRGKLQGNTLFIESKGGNYITIRPGLYIKQSN
jgi:hypothetical protein